MNYNSNKENLPSANYNNSYNNNEVITMESYKSITNKDFYNVGKGKKEPSAKVINQWAKEAHINTETIDLVKNDNEVKVKVRAWIGHKDRPQAEETCVLIYNIPQEMERMLTEHILKATYEKTMTDKDFTFIPENGVLKLRLTNPSKYIIFWKEWQRFLTFSERDLETKAKRRAQLSLMGLEFREEAEIESEIKEIEMVKEAKNGNNSNNSTCKENLQVQKAEPKQEPTEKQKLNRQINKLMEDNNITKDYAKDLLYKTFGISSTLEANESQLKVFIEKLKDINKPAEQIEDTPAPEIIEPVKEAPKQITEYAKDPIEWITNRTNANLNDYINAVEQYFKNSKVLNEDDIFNCMNSHLKEKNIERVNINVYKDIIDHIVADSRDFDAMVIRLRQGGK